MGKALLIVLNLVWLCQAEAYIQNGFINSNPYAPIQTASPPETPPIVEPLPEPPQTAPIELQEEVSSPEVVSNNPAPAIVAPIPRPYSERPATPAPKNEFRVEATTKALGINYKGSQPATQLTSCGALKFGADGKCNPINVAKDFVPVLLEQIPKCVNQALRLDHEAPAASIFVEHMGTYQNRNVADSAENSMHATGRAIDVSKIIITTASGKRIVHNMIASSKNHPFYKNFNQCWTTYQGTKAQCHPKGGGMIDCRDPDHQDHVHLSLPFCPRKPGISGW